MERETILERWLETARQHETVWSSAAKCDSFRNPVEHTLRENLAVLLEQVQGCMDLAAAKTALEYILRIRAVQDLKASEAAGFVFSLRRILHESAPQADLAEIDARIDRSARYC